MKTIIIIILLSELGQQLGFGGSLLPVLPPPSLPSWNSPPSHPPTSFPPSVSVFSLHPHCICLDAEDGGFRAICCTSPPICIWHPSNNSHQMYHYSDADDHDDHHHHYAGDHNDDHDDVSDRALLNQSWLKNHHFDFVWWKLDIYAGNVWEHILNVSK